MNNDIKFLLPHVSPYRETNGANYLKNRGFELNYLGFSDFGADYEVEYWQAQDARKQFFEACKAMKPLNTGVENCYCYVCQELLSCFVFMGDCYMTVTVCPTLESFQILETRIINFQKQF